MENERKHVEFVACNAKTREAKAEKTSRWLPGPRLSESQTLLVGYSSYTDGVDNW